MTAARVGAAEQLQPRHVLQQLVELVARRLLDLAPRDPLHAVYALGLGFGQRLSGDEITEGAGSAGGGRHRRYRMS